MSTDTDAHDDDSIDSDDDSDSPEWTVSDGEYTLAKESYSTYRLTVDAVTVSFSSIRTAYENDDVYELRDNDRTILASFPVADLPDEIRTAFEILRSEA